MNKMISNKDIFKSHGVERNVFKTIRNKRRKIFEHLLRCKEFMRVTIDST